MDSFLPVRPHEMPWNITLLLSILSIQCLNCMFTIVIVAFMHPITSSIYTTLDDINIILPEMNSTLFDVKQLLPAIKEATFTVDSICNSVGCSRV